MVVHVLVAGYTLCGVLGTPCDWPEGHSFVSMTQYRPGMPNLCGTCDRRAQARLEGAEDFVGGPLS